MFTQLVQDGGHYSPLVGSTNIGQNQINPTVFIINARCTGLEIHRGIEANCLVVPSSNALMPCSKVFFSSIISIRNVPFSTSRSALFHNKIACPSSDIFLALDAFYLETPPGVVRSTFLKFYRCTC